MINIFFVMVQVDNNMETLRRALQDNREVFVNIINKTNEDFEMKHNNLVEDLEKVAEAMQTVRVKADQGERKIVDDSLKMQKLITDLEAHINTSIITEKSVRKAQDKHLAEEMDSLLRVVHAIE